MLKTPSIVMEFQLTTVGIQGSETEVYSLFVKERGQEFGMGGRRLSSDGEVLKENWLQTAAFSRLIQNLERQLKKETLFSQQLFSLFSQQQHFFSHFPAGRTLVVREVRTGASTPSIGLPSPVWPRSHPFFLLDAPPSSPCFIDPFILFAPCFQALPLHH